MTAVGVGARAADDGAADGTVDDRFAARLAGRPSAETLVRRLVQAEDGHLVATLGQVAESGALPAAAALVVAARRRYVTGTGKSLAFATLLATDLAVSCSHVHLIDDATVPALDVLAEVTASDVLVAFSFRRYRRETAALATAFAAAGGSLVAITDAADAPLAAKAAVTVVVDTGSASFVDSPTAVVAVSHILATLVGASAKGARRRIAARDQLAADLGLYLAGDAHPGPTPED
ncbi:MAG: SIS domain-containing protein [Cellulomonas sp.]|nr:SIS domain-containing protein [Cellulomonas sp.]